MTAKTMHQSEAKLRAELAALAERLEDIVSRTPRHPQYLYIDPLNHRQRAEHDRAVGYRNAARAIRDVLGAGAIPQDLADDSDLDQIDNE